MTANPVIDYWDLTIVESNMQVESAKWTVDEITSSPILLLDTEFLASTNSSTYMSPRQHAMLYHHTSPNTKERK